MPEVKQSHTAEETIRRRQQNSGDPSCDYSIKTGEGERRTFHNIHLHGHQGKHGEPNKGEGDIFGNRRGPANNPSTDEY